MMLIRQPRGMHGDGLRAPTDPVEQLPQLRLGGNGGVERDKQNAVRHHARTITARASASYRSRFVRPESLAQRTACLHSSLSR